MKTFRNPLLPLGPDPWMVFHNGNYYLCPTEGEHLAIYKAPRIDDLRHVEPQIVWRDCTPSRCTQMWAPEFYLLDGPNGRRWYLYYTACDGQDLAHRMFVLESEHEGDDSEPTGPYQFKAQIATDAKDEFYAIDGSILQTGDGELYFLWAGHPGHVIFIQKMENPWTLTGERVNIPASGFGCDEVREGPVCLRRNGKIFLVYSACDTGKPDYKLGMLEAEEGADLMDPKSWKQHPEPVFTRCDENGVYGPGHNGFFHSPDGSETWIIYHAKSESRYTYEGRNPRAQKINWRADGTPDFGVPLSLETDIPVPSGE
jgi:GH43 family beta-xylosidase